MIRFALPNDVVCVWTSDDVFAADRPRLRSLSIDLAVTNSAINWERRHASLIGEMISDVPSVPPQFVSLQHLDPEQLARLVREAGSNNDKVSTNE